jgi:hypothetical protein
MTDQEEQLLAAEIGDAEVRLRICTDTRVDAGRWWRRTPVWLCLAGDDLVVLAVARRRYIGRVPIVDCSESAYCHGTGELLIGPTEDLRISRMAMSASDALTVLKELNPESRATQTETK